MGHPKQLIEIEGESLIERVVQATLAVPELDHLIVVLGANAAAIRPRLLSLPVIVTETSSWQAGLSQSIHAAIDIVDRDFPETQSVLFTLCDQPHLDTAALSAVIEYAAKTVDSVVAAEYDNHPGPPCLIDRCHFNFLRRLEGDQGARALFQQLPADDLALVDLPQLALDLDTPKDLARWRREQTDDR